MKVFINTFQTDISYLHQMNDSEDYIMCEEELQATEVTFPVCLSLEDENGNIIASSGCYPEFPNLTNQFVQDWFKGGFSEIEIIEMGNEILLVTDVDSNNILITENNQLPEIPSEIYLAIEPYQAEDQKDLFYSLPQISSETEAHLIEVEEFYRENPTGGEHSFQQMIVEEGLQRKDKGQFLDFINNEGEHFSQEARQIKHVLIKRKDLPKRVDWEMLVNSTHLIWNAGHLLGLGQDPNNIVIVEGQEAVKNLELFLSLMSNPKFATLSSFQIEKHHGKN